MRATLLSSPKLPSMGPLHTHVIGLAVIPIAGGHAGADMIAET